MRKSIYGVIFLALGLSATMAVSHKADFVATLREKLKAFYEDKNRVKIHLILNQPEYVAGDTAYFNAYLVQGENLRPASGKRILNLEIISRMQEILIHIRIVCKEGMGAGQLILPDNLEAGSYGLIAYTDGGDDPLTPPPVFQTELLIGGETEFIKKGNGIELFPEGGSLVTGIRTKVVVRIPGKDSTARVMNSSGKRIAEFTTRSSGLGSFFITPESGERYYVQSRAGKKELLEAKPDGTGLHVENSSEEKSFRVVLQVPKASIWGREELYLVLTSGGTICFSKSVTFEKDTLVTLSVPRSDCREGVAQLTLFTPKGDVLAERLVWIEPKPVEVQVFPEATQFQVRNPVKVDIRLKDFSELPVPSRLSLSVYKEDLFSNSARIPDFQESVLLEGNLVPGFGSFPEFAKSSGDEVSDYLITRQWGSFRWNEVFAERQEKPMKGSPPPFYFKGRVLSVQGGAIPDSTSVTFYLNRNDFVYVLYTRRNGEFEFPLFMDFSDDEIFYAIHYKGKECKDAFLSLPGDPPAPWPLSSKVSSENSDAYAVFSKSKRPILKSFDYYLSKSNKDKMDPGADQSDYAGFDDVDVVADIEKYKKFSSMKEVLMEVVPAVKHKRINNQDAVRVFLQESAMFASENPLYFIDGVITDSTAYFLALDPDRISRVKVLRSKKTLARFGDLGKNGIVVVESKAPAKTHPVPLSRRTLRITGVTPSLPFLSPDYSRVAPSHVPDLRAALCWRPQIALDKEGKSSLVFYTGDATGSFVIRIEGITDDGHPFSKETRFTVSLDRP